MVLKSSRSMNSTATGSVVALLTFERVDDAVAEQRSVRQSRDRVVEGLVGELLLERLALGDVTRVQHDALDVRVVQQARPERLDEQVGTVGVPDTELHQSGASLAVTARREERHDTRAIVGMHEVDEARALQLEGASPIPGARWGSRTEPSCRARARSPRRSSSAPARRTVPRSAAAADPRSVRRSPMRGRPASTGRSTSRSRCETGPRRSRRPAGQTAPPAGTRGPRTTIRSASYPSRGAAPAPTRRARRGTRRVTTVFRASTSANRSRANVTPSASSPPAEAATTKSPASVRLADTHGGGASTRSQAASIAARCKLSRPVAVTSSAPASRNALSRRGEGLLGPGETPMRATTSPNSTIVAPTNTMKSRSSPRTTWIAKTTGATSDAPARSTRRGNVIFHVGFAGGLRQLAHRRMQRGDTEQDVERHPSALEQSAARLVARGRCTGRTSRRSRP